MRAECPIDATVEGILYLLWAQDGGLAGARFDKAIDGGNHTRLQMGDIVGKPALSGDDADTVANEKNTMLTVGGATFTIGDLLGAGVASSNGERFVGEALAKVEKARSSVAALLNLENKPATIGVLLTEQWTNVKLALDPVFKTNSAAATPTTRIKATTPREEDILDELDDIVAALSSVDAFVAATAKDGDGVFESAELSSSKATDAFDRVSWTGAATLGSSGSTRYGTVIRKQTNDALTGAKYSYSFVDDDNDPSTADVRESTGEFGAFSYATMQETLRTRHVQQQTGIATYTGGTHAINTEGTAYTGKMRVQIRFNSDSVSGVVTGLEDADGQPWQHNFTDVDSIILPDATLKPNAKWSGSATATNPAYINYTAGSGVVAPHRETADAKFDGILLGLNAKSGSEANGTWSISALNNDSNNRNYLAGAYGVVRGDDATSPAPGTDDGSTASSSTFFINAPPTGYFDNGILTQSNATVGDGKLKLTLDSFGWRPDDPDNSTSTTEFGALYVSTADADGNNNSQSMTVEFGLADLVAAGANKTHKGSTHVSKAVKVIQQQRDILATLATLPDSTPNTTAKTNAWNAVKNELQYRVFGAVPAKLNKTWAEAKDEALDLIDRALDALASDAALEAAIDGDGTGIFKDVANLDPATPTGGTKAVKVKGRTAANIRAEREYDVIARLGSTTYTRFGVWRHKATRNAVRTGSNTVTNATAGARVVEGDVDDGDSDPALQGPGLLAYSLLDPTVADSVTAVYPVNGKATYMGETVAVQNTAILIGEVQADVSWGAALANATLALTIRNLANDNGDPLADSNVANSIAEIVISGMSIVKGTDNIGSDKNAGQLIVGNAGDASVFNTSGTVKYNYADKSIPQGDGTGAEVRALFVGQNSDGPLGLIGSWKLADGDVGRVNAAGTTLLDSTSTIYGAFGAEDAP